jgi:membrane-associated PAP2 superfamily phosphatase
MALVAASFTRYASSWSKKNRRVLIILLLSLVLVPASAGIGKQLTHVHCPWDLTRYGGKVPYVTILEHPPHGTESIKRGVCFPAGHASGGFALMSLYFVFSDRRKQWIGLWFGIACGWIMGAYQMLVGAHFLSHTIFMMLQAWFVILLIARCANSKTALVPPTKTEPDNRV